MLESGIRPAWTLPRDETGRYMIAAFFESGDGCDIARMRALCDMYGIH